MLVWKKGLKEAEVKKVHIKMCPVYPLYPNEKACEDLLYPSIHVLTVYPIWYHDGGEESAVNQFNNHNEESKQITNVYKSHQNLHCV